MLNLKLNFKLNSNPDLNLEKIRILQQTMHYLKPNMIELYIHTKELLDNINKNVSEYGLNVDVRYSKSEMHETEWNRNNSILKAKKRI